MMMKIIYFCLLYLLFSLSSCLQNAKTQNQPYPSSTVIDSIVWDFDNAIRLAPGSDLWPVTWADDGHLYTSWGDGGGFGGTNSNGRVSLGFGRIEGPPDTLVERCSNPDQNADNIWGGACTENTQEFTGKVPGMASIDGVLYAWLHEQVWPQVRMLLIWSFDHGATWHRNDWRFGGTSTDTLRILQFLQFGRDYSGAIDNYVYMYAQDRGGIDKPPDKCYPGVYHLIRVPREHSSIIDRSSYEFLTGTDSEGNPMWTSDIGQRTAVFNDPNGAGIPSVSYNPGIDRYLLTAGHGCGAGNSLRRLGIFDAPEPWGPWTTVDYYNDWGGYTGYRLGYYIPTKTPDWMSEDGLNIHLVFSGDNKLDSFNLLSGILQLSGTGAN